MHYRVTNHAVQKPPEKPAAAPAPHTPPPSEEARRLKRELSAAAGLIAQLRNEILTLKARLSLK